MSSNITFWVSTAGIPISVFVLNIGTRLIKQLPISAGADWILILWSFDVVALINFPVYLSHVTDDTLRESLPSILGIMLVLGIFIWIYCVFLLEPALDSIRSKNKLWDLKNLFQIVFTISLVCVDTWAHFSIFVFNKTI